MESPSFRAGTAKDQIYDAVCEGVGSSRAIRLIKAIDDLVEATIQIRLEEFAKQLSQKSVSQTR